MEDNIYDRMNPNVQMLLKRLEEYSDIDYGINAYPLSKAEAQAILDLIKKLSTYQIKVRD